MSAQRRVGFPVLAGIIALVSVGTESPLHGAGPLAEAPAPALVPYFPYSAPYEDVRLKP
jgi:hypothetical protein